MFSKYVHYVINAYKSVTSVSTVLSNFLEFSIDTVLCLLCILFRCSLQLNDQSRTPEKNEWITAHANYECFVFQQKPYGIVELKPRLFPVSCLHFWPSVCGYCIHHKIYVYNQPFFCSG